MADLNANRKQQEKIFGALAAAYVCLLSTVSFLAMPAAGFADMTKFKYHIFLAVTGGYCAVSVLMWLEMLIVGMAKPADLLHSPAFSGRARKMLLIFAAVSLVSALCSPYRSAALLGGGRDEGALTVGIYVLSALILSARLRPKEWMLHVFGGAFTLFALLCVIQLAGGNPLGLYPEGLNYYGANVDYSGAYLGTIGNVDLCAAVMCGAAGLFLMALIRLESRTRLLFLVPMCAAVYLIVKAGVAAGYVGLAGGMLLMLPAAARDRRTLSNTLLFYGAAAAAAALACFTVFYNGGSCLTFSKRTCACLVPAAVLAAAGAAWGRSEKLPVPSEKAMRRIAVGAILAALAAGAAVIWNYSGGSGTLYEAHELLHGRAQDTFGSGRVYIWRQCLDVFVQRPILGGGPDTLGLRGIPDFTRYDSATGKLFTASIDAAHNEYLNILVNQGVLGLAAYLGALICAAAAWYRRPEDAFAAVGGAGVLFYCVQAFFGISTSYSSMMLWTALALTLRADVKNAKYL